MTVRLAQIDVATHSADSYVGHRPLKADEFDVLVMHFVNGLADLPTPLSSQLIVSAVRHELREEHSPRGNAVIPSVKGLILTHGFDEYGNNLFVDLEYDGSGHRATYGGHVTCRETRSIKWTCYMD